MDLTVHHHVRGSRRILYWAFTLYIFILVVVNNVLQLETRGFLLEFALVAAIVFIGAVGLGRRICIPRIVLLLAFAFFIVSVVGALANPDIQAVIYLAQVAFSFVLIVVLYSFFSQDQLSHLYETFWRVSLVVAAMALLAFFIPRAVGFLNPESFYWAGRLKIVGGNANFTGYFFASATVYFFLKFGQSMRLDYLAFAGASLFPVFLSGSFGAVGALCILIPSIFLLKLRISSADLVVVALIVVILTIDFADLILVLGESEIRAVRRVGELAQLLIQGQGALDQLGSSGERLTLIREVLNEISQHIYFLTGMGFDYWLELSLTNKVHVSFLNVWISLGLLSALAYMSIFILALSLAWRAGRPGEVAVVLLAIFFSCMTPSLYRREFLLPVCLIIARSLKSHDA